MADNVVIVAIPSQDDYVWKVSSEKVPHMTILFLGEAKSVENLPDIIGFVEHAADVTLKRFYMDVDRRGILGEDEADVLFFNKTYDKSIETFRSYLLKDDNIRTAYDSVEQFPEWHPHLTLGYPGSPAKEDERDYPQFYGVHFDKIAVWFGDYEGIEIPLKSYDWDMEVSMSSIDAGKAAVEAALAHYGVKGMQWGVRKSDSSGKTTEAHVRKIKPRKHMKTKVATRGGRAQPAVKEAVDVRVLQQTLKKSGPNALTNAQLKVMQERLNLEQNVGRLSKTKQNKVAKEWVQGELKKEGSRRIQGLVAADMAKVAAKRAAAAAALAV